MKKLLICSLMILLVCCTVKTETTNPDSSDSEQAKQTLKAQVAKAEDDFKNLSESKGIQEAFYAFADENAVIKREKDTLIHGKENIKSYYSNPKFKNASVTWKPDFVGVSDDGTQAYTYGKYVWTVKDSLGNKKDFKGIFHTVWKKQKDGSWKYVWD